MFERYVMGLLVVVVVCIWAGGTGVMRLARVVVVRSIKLSSRLGNAYLRFFVISIAVYIVSGNEVTCLDAPPILIRSSLHLACYWKQSLQPRKDRYRFYRAAFILCTRL